MWYKNNISKSLRTTRFILQEQYKHKKKTKDNLKKTAFFLRQRILKLTGNYQASVRLLF